MALGQIPTRGRPATVRVARWSATHPWRAILLWLTFVAACIALGSSVGTRSATNTQLGVGQAGHADRILHNAGLVDPATENVVITSRSGPFDAQRAHAAANEVTAKMRGLTEVSKVDAPITSADGRALLVGVSIAGDPDHADKQVPKLLAVTSSVQKSFPNLYVDEVGGASIDKAVNATVGKDFGKAESMSLPITLIILLVAFGAIIAAGVPVLLAMSAVGAAIGLSQLVSHLLPNPGTTSNVILLMGMAVGVDYSLFYLKREREERARGRSRINAIEVAAETSGHAVLVSGLAVLAAMAGLYLSSDLTFAAIGTASILVVGVAMLGSLTVLPALLAKLGRRVDRPRVPVLWRLTNRPDRNPRLWPAILRPALNHPGRTLIVSIIVVGALAAPALGLKLRNGGADTLPRSIPALQSYDRMTAHFPNQQSSHEVVVTAPASSSPAVVAALDEVEKQASSDPLFQLDANPTRRVSTDGRVHTLNLATPFDENSAKGKQSLAKLRKTLLPSTVGKVPGASAYVTGGIASNVDYTKHIGDRLPLVIGFVLLLTFIIMVTTFRAPLIALATIAVNMFSAAAAFGILVLVFQMSWAETLLNFHSTGAVINWIPLYLFVVLFGLSMDYHVFVLTRVQEAFRRGLSAKEAVREGISRSAGVVTSAAVVMVSVFAIFAALSLVEFKELGVGLAAAVLLDALVVRGVILPSLLVLLGRAAWWRPGAGRKPEAEVVELLPEPAGVR